MSSFYACLRLLGLLALVTIPIVLMVSVPGLALPALILLAVRMACTRKDQGFQQQPKEEKLIPGLPPPESRRSGWNK